MDSGPTEPPSGRRQRHEEASWVHGNSRAAGARPRDIGALSSARLAFYDPDAKTYGEVTGPPLWRGR
jgi:hypothetical protein